MKTAESGGYVIAVALIVLAVSYGLRDVFGLFILPLQAHFGWSRAEVAAAASLNVIA